MGPEGQWVELSGPYSVLPLHQRTSNNNNNNYKALQLIVSQVPNRCA